MAIRDDERRNGSLEKKTVSSVEELHDVIVSTVEGLLLQKGGEEEVVLRVRGKDVRLRFWKEKESVVWMRVEVKSSREWYSFHTHSDHLTARDKTKMDSFAKSAVAEYNKARHEKNVVAKIWKEHPKKVASALIAAALGLGVGARELKRERALKRYKKWLAECHPGGSCAFEEMP